MISFTGFKDSSNQSQKYQGELQRSESYSLVKKKHLIKKFKIKQKHVAAYLIGEKNSEK